MVHTNGSSLLTWFFQRLEDAQSLENIDEKLKNLLNEKLWAHVVQEEKAGAGFNTH